MISPSLFPSILRKSNLEDTINWYDNLSTIGGFLLIDKNTDWTSFDVVAKLRGIIKIKKIGHAGTLDPLATGLLIIGCGKATKKLDHFQAIEKEYFATIKLGATTVTDDREAEEENPKDVDIIDDDIIRVCHSYIGEIEQTPPIYSAIKVKGKRLYKLARSNKTADIPVRKVSIFDINIKKIELPFVDIVVKCSKGTYIRSLARDIGENLGTGAYLYNLRRTAIGEESVKEAFQINELEELFKERINSTRK